MKETLKAMKKTLFLTGIICILFLSSCAPKVTSRMTKLYEPLPEETPVLVFSSQNSVPEKAEILGEVLPDSIQNCEVRMPTSEIQLPILFYTIILILDVAIKILMIN